MNICNGCKLVKYCNAKCKKKHRGKHKKKCQRRAAELHDEVLFKQPSPRDECPICMLPLPIDFGGTGYRACCGKIICNGCHDAAALADNRQLCPFCRTPDVSGDEAVERLKKRAEGDDAQALYNLGCLYNSGIRGLPQNYEKATKLWLRAGELGNAMAYYNAAICYENGEGVERDEAKAKYYWELGAMGGDVMARHNLRVVEAEAGNMKRAMKHWMISVGAGCDMSLKAIRGCFMHGAATKDDFEKALRAHKEAADEMKSDQREAAAAFRANQRGGD